MDDMESGVSTEGTIKVVLPGCLQAHTIPLVRYPTLWKETPIPQNRLPKKSGMP